MALITALLLRAALMVLGEALDLQVNQQHDQGADRRSDPRHPILDLGSDHYDRHANTSAKRRSHIRQLEGLGYKVTLEPAA